MDNSENGELNTISEPSESHINSEQNSQELQEETENTLHDEEQREKLLQLPLGRIKTIIKTDPEVHLINQEAVFLIAKSTVNVIRVEFQNILSFLGKFLET